MLVLIVEHADMMDQHQDQLANGPPHEQLDHNIDCMTLTKLETHEQVVGVYSHTNGKAANLYHHEVITIFICSSS